jgi:hypothetical protein
VIYLLIVKRSLAVRASGSALEYYCRIPQYRTILSTTKKSQFPRILKWLNALSIELLSAIVRLYHNACKRLTNASFLPFCFGLWFPRMKNLHYREARYDRGSAIGRFMADSLHGVFSPLPCFQCAYRL